MARSYLACGEFWKAEPLLKRSLSITERVHGTAAALLWILVELSEGYARKNSDQAGPLMQRSFEILRSFLDAKNPTCRYEISDAPEDRAALYSTGSLGLLERLVGASEMARGNLRRRWGA